MAAKKKVKQKCRRIKRRKVPHIHINLSEFSFCGPPSETLNTLRHSFVFAFFPMDSGQLSQLIMAKKRKNLVGK